MIVVFKDLAAAMILTVSVPVIIALLFLCLLLTMVAVVLLAPSAWAAGISMKKYLDQSYIEFWTGDWMEK